MIDALPGLVSGAGVDAGASIKEEEKAFAEDIRIKYHGGHINRIPTTYEVGIVLEIKG